MRKDHLNCLVTVERRLVQRKDELLGARTRVATSADVGHGEVSQLVKILLLDTDVLQSLRDLHIDGQLPDSLDGSLPVLGLGHPRRPSS